MNEECCLYKIFLKMYDFDINGDFMQKIKMLLLVFQLEGMLKGTVHRKSDYLELKKILDSIRNKIFEAKTGIL